MEKKLKFSNDISWNWHKSWNIPNFFVKIDVNYLKLDKRLK